MIYSLLNNNNNNTNKKKCSKNKKCNTALVNFIFTLTHKAKKRRAKNKFHCMKECNAELQQLQPTTTTC